MSPGFELIDGKARNKRTKSFEIPPAPEVKALRSGDYVKVGVEGFISHSLSGERFWVRLTAVDKGRMCGLVEQGDMLFDHQHGIKHGAVIRFYAKHVLAIMKQSESTAFMGLARN